MYLRSLPEVTSRAKMREHLGSRMLASHCFGWVFQNPEREPPGNERRLAVMKIQTFVIGYVLALALFLFAQQRPESTQPGGFREVVDLTHSLPTPDSRVREQVLVSFADRGYGGKDSFVRSRSLTFGPVCHPNRRPGPPGAWHVDRGPDSGWPPDRAAGRNRCQRQRQEQSGL